MTTLEIAQPPTLAAPERTSGLRRWASVLAMVVGPWGFVVVNLCYLRAIRDGGSDSTGAEALALYAAHPTLIHLAVLAGPLACILIVPAVLGWFRERGRPGYPQAGPVQRAREERATYRRPMGVRSTQAQGERT